MNDQPPPAPEAAADPGPLARLRARPENPHAFRGYGPLLALAILVALIVLLAPTVAPEQIVLRPSGQTSTTVEPTTTTSTTAEPADDGGAAP